MHFFIDENLSHRIANALHHLAQLCTENHTVVHAREFNGRLGVPDQEWLERLQAEGNWVIISKDRFKKGDPERLAFEHAGITIINLGKDWHKKSAWDTAVQLIKWWPTISWEVLKLNHPMRYDLPWGVTPKLKGKTLPQKK
ncbi:DUF5615 family PIN-like protein [Halomonas salipaludis]|uniref:VapC45 PIN like domain-containing protein n=1 Tax=Halomonas salipaludis TaxID=2032625 RepID=A0A2A2EWJ2_9GAMM|nr:DUF5615 family PIN-like protein [Halomonas salipaludis]PAU76749.1 hypothetical protein CK498_12260 [Halomonas salipaludis]